MRNIEFVPKAFKEFQKWIETDRNIAIKIANLIRAINTDPFKGIGKPEPLKHQKSGYWSRRINNEHRLVYCVNDDTIVIFSCFSHYN
jgi:toxin YoeB